MSYAFAIGTSPSVTTLFDLSIPAPRQSYKRGSVDYLSGDAQQEVRGYPIVTWDWGFLRKAWRDILVQYRTGSDIYIVTPDDTLAWKKFRVSLSWPLDPEDIQNTRTVKHVLIFYVKEDVT